MSNAIVSRMKAFIGKEMAFSPSRITHWLNGILIDVEAGFTKASFTVKSDWVNPQGTLHGGITATIMDDMMGATLHSAMKENYYTTINLSIDYFKPVSEQDTILVETSIIKDGKTIVHLESKVMNTENKLVAKGFSNVINTGKKRRYEFP